MISNRCWMRGGGNLRNYLDFTKIKGGHLAAFLFAVRLSHRVWGYPGMLSVDQSYAVSQVG